MHRSRCPDYFIELRNSEPEQKYSANGRDATENYNPENYALTTAGLHISIIVKCLFHFSVFIACFS